MTKELFKKQKKIVLILSIIILFGITLSGCNWFGEGILNVFDPKAQIRVNFTDVKFAEGEGTIDLEIFSINQVEFIGEGFNYKYYSKGVLIPELTKPLVGLAFYVAPSNTPGSAGEKTEIKDLPLYYQEVLDYVATHLDITEITCTVSLIGTDGAGHSLSKSITVDFPAIQPGIDFEPPEAVIEVFPGASGIAPFDVIFDASKSKDNRGIASYSWDFGDGTTGTGVTTSHTYTRSGVYPVILTVIDGAGNVGYDSVVINVGLEAKVFAIIKTTPDPAVGSAPFTVGLDASMSSTSAAGASIASYTWIYYDPIVLEDIPHGPYTIPIHTATFEKEGTYLVQLTVKDTLGNEGYAFVSITVNKKS